jgi:predicted AAA+ superfamily ATPase
MDLLVDFNESPKNLLNLVDLSSDPVVFIDEIQYLENPSNFLKYLYDAYHDKMRLVVTGSSAFYLNEKFGDSLVGRKRVLVMPTFSFREFLFFKEKEEIGKQANKVSLTKTTHRELLALFEEFATFGGYPEVVVTPDKEEKKAILKEIATSYMKRDILERGLKREDKFLALTKMLAGQIGNLLNKNEFSRLLGISTTAVENYIHALTSSFHISLITPFYTNISKEIVKMPKVYFNDLGFRNQVLKDFRNFNDRQDQGSIIENVYLCYLSENKKEDIKYWRNKSGLEIDFVFGNEAVEIKKSCRSSCSKQIKAFSKNHSKTPVKILCLKNYQNDKQSLIKNIL